MILWKAHTINNTLRVVFKITGVLNLWMGWCPNCGPCWYLAMFLSMVIIRYPNIVFIENFWWVKLETQILSGYTCLSHRRPLYLPTTLNSTHYGWASYYKIHNDALVIPDFMYLRERNTKVNHQMTNIYIRSQPASLMTTLFKIAPTS